MRNKYAKNIFFSRGLDLLIALIVTFTSIPSNIRSISREEWPNIAISIIIGVLGIVPGVLTLYEQEEASAVVSIVSGTISLCIAVYTIMFKYRVLGANEVPVH